MVSDSLRRFLFLTLPATIKVWRGCFPLFAARFLFSDNSSPFSPSNVPKSVGTSAAARILFQSLISFKYNLNLNICQEKICLKEFVFHR